MNSINKAICLYDLIKDQINPTDNIFDAFDEYDDFEIELTDNGLFTSEFSRTNFIQKDNLNLDTTLKIRIKNGLFTDSSGYCHKIAINKDIYLTM